MALAFQEVFDRFRAAFRRYAGAGVELCDETGRYYVGSNEVRAKDGYRTALGGVEIKKNYVSVHLMPVYVHPSMLEGVSDSLLRRMQGKSCFNFRVEDPALFAELEALIDAGAAQFERDGRLNL